MPEQRKSPDGRSRRGLGGFIPAILVGIGALLLAEALLTVAWREPFSAFATHRAQTGLARNLATVENQERDAENRLRTRRQVARYISQRAVALNHQVAMHKGVGRLTIRKLGLNFVVVQGTDSAGLVKGPAHYPQTPLPGTRGHWTVGIAGHRTTYLAPFRHIDRLRRGDPVVVTMPYARFTYLVVGTKIVDAGDTRVFRPQGTNMLVLTACHPLFSAAQRIVVYARLKRMTPVGHARRLLERAGSAPAAHAANAATRKRIPAHPARKT